MNVRWQSLKVRYAIISSLFIAVVLLVNALILICFKYLEFQKDIDQRASSFAYLAVKPICDGYETYYASGYLKFKELMRYTMTYEPDLTNIKLIDMNGRVLFNSDNLSKNHFVPQSDEDAPVIRDPYYLDAIRKLDPSQRNINSEDHGRGLEIISPYKDDWGRHKLSVIMHFSYRALEPQIRIMIYQVTGLTLLSMLFASFLTWIVTGKITEPLDQLTEEVRGLMKGTQAVPEDETTENEIQLLTNTFAAMTSRIQEYIQQLETSNTKLASLNEELKELDRMKSDLLANVSHELRTPLTSIKGYTEYILEGKLGPVGSKQEKGLMVVQRNLERLSKLINALLDYSLMDADRMVLTVKPFDIKLLCKQIVVNIGSELETRNLEFQIEMADDLPLVVGDKEKIYQVLENLTINAIKFTERGGKITLSAEPLETDGKFWIKVCVHDTGIGIPQPALQRIFDRFYQVDATSKRKYGGMGLGLAIARSIIDAHKGRIDVESTLGKGTNFIITLPTLNDTLEVSKDLRLKKSNGESFLVQVIDDDPNMLQLMKMHLEDEGFRVMTSDSTKHGLETARKYLPDAIVLDALLPDDDGFNLLQTLKSRHETSMIPVLILSMIKERMKGMRMGAADYLVKPVGNSLLKATLQRILGQNGGTVLIVDDEADAVKFLRERLEEEGFHTIEASNGKDAIEKATEKTPDLILLDILMPEINGWDVMERLQENDGTASIPIVVLSAAGTVAEKQSGNSGGVRNYLSKPVEIRDLINEIKKVVLSRANHSS